MHTSVVMNRLFLVLKSVFIFSVLVNFSGCRNKTESHEPVQTEVEGVVKNSFEELKNGNRRFIEDHPIHPHQTLERMRNLQSGQHPFAVVISCADSRVPPELVFDQGLGDLFVIRNAGNIIGDYELGSVEYAIEHLHTNLIVVLGHEGCGAIEAFIEHKHDTLPNHIHSIIDYIRQEPEEIALDENDENYHALAVEANVHHGVNVLRQSHPVISEAANDGRVEIVGGIYHMDSGVVRWLED